MAKIDGKYLRIVIDGAEIVGSTTDDISFEGDSIDTTTKDSTDGFKESIGGELGVTFTATFAFDEDAAATNVEDLYDAWEGRSIVPFQYGGTETGNLVWEGDCRIESISVAGPKNEMATVDVSFVATGVVTKAVVS